jgi:Calpain family cysteine protease
MNRSNDEILHGFRGAIVAGLLAALTGLVPMATVRADDGGGFAAQVATSFEHWDLDYDGFLSFRETGLLVPDTTIRGDAAASLAAIHRVQRGKTWHHASFSRQDLIATTGGAGRRPPFELYFRQSRAHIGSAQPALFADGGPSLHALKQGPLGDYFLLATVGAAVDRDPAWFHKAITGESGGPYRIAFPGHGIVSVPSVSDAEIALGSNGGGQGAWLSVLEKAYGQIAPGAFRSEHEDEPAIDEGSGHGTSTLTLSLLTGHGADTLRFRPHGSPRAPEGHRLMGLVSEARALFLQLFAARRLVCCGTTTAATPPGIVPNHMYAVLGFDPSTNLVRVWNPWGNHFEPQGVPGLQNGYPVLRGAIHGPA